MSKPYNHINYKNTELGWIPSDWKLKILNDIGVFTKGKGISKDEVTDNGKFPSIRYADIYTTYNYYTENLKYYIDEKSALESYKISKGDILFAGSGETVDEIGKSIVYFGEGDAYAGGDIIVLRQKSENSLFLGYLFNSSKIKKQLIKLGQGNSVVHIYSSSLKKLKLALPPIPEQQKIAQILSTWDKAIAQQEQLIAQKRQLKKGMMQQLLTAKLRFPGFVGEWEMVKLGEISIKKSSNISANSIENNFGDFWIYGAQGQIKKINYYSENQKYISIVKDGAGIGRVKLCEQNSSVLGTLDIIRNNLKTDLNFLYFKLKAINFLKYSIGSTIPHIYYSVYKKHKIKIPKLKEQQKIAQFLTAMDTEIDILQTQLTHLQTQKQGLMQVLLTGEIRVKV